MFSFTTYSWEREFTIPFFAVRVAGESSPLAFDPKLKHWDLQVKHTPDDGITKGKALLLFALPWALAEERVFYVIYHFFSFFCFPQGKGVSSSPSQVGLWSNIHWPRGCCMTGKLQKKKTAIRSSCTQRWIELRESFFSNNKSDERRRVWGHWIIWEYWLSMADGFCWKWKHGDDGRETSKSFVSVCHMFHIRNIRVISEQDFSASICHFGVKFLS